MRTGRGGATATREAIDGDLPTTAGSLALTNLHAQIDGQERQAVAGVLGVDGHAQLIELVTLRGRVLGSVADYEWAHARAEQLTQDYPTDGVALLARARTRATFHRFTEALLDLDEARRLGADAAVVDAERAAVFQAIGRYDEALTLMRVAVKRRADFASLAAQASLCAEVGDVATAEQLFDQSRDRYRTVSPIPLAQLHFQRAKMWLAQGDLRRGRCWLAAADRRLPAYAPVQGHLAEVEAALGETDAAIARLHPLTISSDDPDYPSQLARTLTQVGRAHEARQWRERAATRYDELVARHLEAFADHAAEFWLDAGGDPHRAQSLARSNLEVRQTPRAHKLLARATRAVDAARDTARR